MTRPSNSYKIHLEAEPKQLTHKINTNLDKFLRPNKNSLQISLVDQSKQPAAKVPNTYSKPKNLDLKKLAERSPSNDSFEADDNLNELELEIKRTNSKKQNKSPKFELEMRKHGLLDKIKHIQQLNCHLGAELGSARGDEQNSMNDNSMTSINDRSGYVFPFQKRARSNSPPRGVAPFAKAESPMNNASRKPVVVTRNFIIGPNSNAKKIRGKVRFGQKPEYNDLLIKHIENEEGMLECCGLSTGPTDEEKKGELLGDEWMYQRIPEPDETQRKKEKLEESNKIPENNLESNGPGGGDPSFLQLLNTLQFDS